MHFGKKSDPWDSHSTLHFGKKSSPWDDHSTMHFGKRDPWDYHNTLHFGKRFDPWEGHAKMHFGKRTGDWDHNVMHFGKRDEITPDELQNIRSAEDLLALVNPTDLRDLIEEKSSQQGIDDDDDEETRDFLENLKNLEGIINSHLRDENIPFEEKISLLKSYLKPILKVLLSEEIDEDTKQDFFPIVKEYFDKDINIDIGEDSKERDGLSNIIPSRTILNDVVFEDSVFPKERDDIAAEEYAENPKILDNLKSKRTYFGKPELKRYFVPFQGPKSIVYPHAWFASQIRRSSLPRTTTYGRNMDIRMAEKKEDPFNSYMHFGRR